MDDYRHDKLKHIRDKAMERVEKCIEEGSWHSAGEAMDIAKDADHICRKWWTMKKEHPDWFRT